MVIKVGDLEVRAEEFLDEGAKSIGVGQVWDLVAELEIVENVLDVPREAI